MSVSEAIVLDRAPDIQVERWPTDRPLFFVALLCSLLLWLVAVVSVIGIIYGLIFGAVFFVMHVGFVAHVRGSGVRLGPEQFPELYERVRELSTRMGIARMPEVYLMQAGGSLNAFATRFLGANIVVLFTDLLEACGEDEAARDMIIAHELGHVKENHLRWHWVLLPANLIPFLGGALSRAREYTCDRYGLAGAGNVEGALHGLTILSAGGAYASRVNRAVLVRQRAAFNTGWMTIGEWLSTHPSLVKRLVALDPSLETDEDEREQGPLRALGILGLMIVLPVIASIWFAASALPAWLDQVEQASQMQSQTAAAAGVVPADAAEQVELGFATLSAAAMAEVNAGRGLPADDAALYEAWARNHQGVAEPFDPYDGQRFGYVRRDDGFTLWSSGPDRSPGTADDVIYESPEYGAGSGL